MAIKLGSIDINSLNLGSVGLNRIYSGSDTVFGGAAPYVPFLENLTASPDFAWSVWQPHSSVTNCVRLRRSSVDPLRDNDELDFGYVNGYVDVDSIASWGGVDTLYVVTFYSYLTDATELIIENQVIWKNSGGVNNLAAIDKTPLISLGNIRTYKMSTNITTINNYTLLLVENKLASNTINTGYTFSTFNPSRGYEYNLQNQAATRPNTQSTLGAVDVGENIIEFNRVDFDIFYYLNNIFIINNTNDNTDTIQYLFGTTSTDRFVQSELIFFKSSLGASDRSQYYTDYNSRYNKTV